MNLDGIMIISIKEIIKIKIKISKFLIKKISFYKKIKILIKKTIWVK